MSSLNYNPEQKVMLDHLLLNYPEVSAGVVFGLPCYKVNGVVFVTLYGEGVGIKLPEARVKELLEQPECVPFRPFGRNRGKQFVQINHENPRDYLHDQSLFEEAMYYVGAISAGQKNPSPQIPILERDEEEQRFRSIAALLTSENSAITLDQMMSSPALHYQGKVFAFYSSKKMVFRLGRDFQPESFDIQHYSLLAPFKTKPPMVDWFEIPSADQHRGRNCQDMLSSSSKSNERGEGVMNSLPTFAGFPQAGLEFLANLATHNNRVWFEAHKNDYQVLLLEPAQAFVLTLGAKLQMLSNDIRCDTRTDGRGVLMRLHRDTRFNPDKSPYHTHLNGLFWEGGQKKTERPAFGFQIEATGIALMTGIFKFPPAMLVAYRDAVRDDHSGADLEDILETVRRARTYEIAGEQYKRVHSGYDPNHRRADLLRYDGLYAFAPRLAVSDLLTPALVDMCYAHFQQMAPIYHWLMKVAVTT